MKYPGRLLDDIAEDGNPLIEMTYNFLCEPKTSSYGTLWGYFVACLVIFHIFVMCLETCDGPNQYDGRKDVSRFKFLLTTQQYVYLEDGLMIPLTCDAVFRVLMLGFIYCSAENKPIRMRLSKNRLAGFLLFCDIFGVVPFVLKMFSVISVRPNSDSALGIQVVELLSIGRILRISKDEPSIWAIRVALSVSSIHLVVPIFFFLIFNITAAVFFYFSEPCFNVQICTGVATGIAQFLDLFEASFFAVVTMTTTGYGNQIPQFELGRFFACFVMLGGSLFISMPLAIIGQAYTQAWEEISQNLLKKRQEEVAAEQLRVKQLYQRATIRANIARPPHHSGSLPSTLHETTGPGPGLPQSLSLLSHDSPSALALPAAEAAQQKQIEILACSPLQESFNQLSKTLKELSYEERIIDYVSPTIYFKLCEVQGWLSSLIFNLDMAICTACPEIDDEKLSQATAGEAPRRMSIVGGLRVTVAPISALVAETTTDNESNRWRSGSQSTDSGESVHSTTNFVSSLWSQIRTAYQKFKTHTHEKEREARIKQCEESPTSLRNRLWMLLELHQSSREAQIVQITLLALILLSVLLLYTETLTTWTRYGEGQNICQRVLKKYCPDKLDPQLDPGCFVATQWGEVPTKRLLFDCTGRDCWGSYANFGSLYGTNLTCTNTNSPPFQTLPQLADKYRLPYLMTSRPEMHRLSAVCSRIECINNDATLSLTDANWFWKNAEVVITVIFTMEFLARASLAESLPLYLADTMNLFDLLAILPFYVDVIHAGSLDKANFSILASAPDALGIVVFRAFKVFRLFKLTRHFEATEVLTNTAHRISQRVFGMLMLLCFLVVIFALTLYYLERGKSCYYGEPGCEFSNAPLGTKAGQKIWINSLGNPTMIPNAMFGIWFSFVTITSTGYGDIYPITNGGKIFGIVLMLAGSMYLSMPLTVTSSEFCDVRLQWLRRKEAKKVHPDDNDEQAATQAELTKARQQFFRRKRLLQISSTLANNHKQLSGFLEQIHNPGVSRAFTNTNTAGTTEGDESAVPQSKLVGGVHVSPLMAEVGALAATLRSMQLAAREEIENLALTFSKSQLLENDAITLE